MHIAVGGHDKRGDEMCVMEWVAFFAGEPHSDHPQCACPVLAAALRVANDSMLQQDRDKLEKLIPKLIGSRSTQRVELKRMFVLVDAAVRRWAPIALEKTGLNNAAEKLRSLDPVKDVESAAAADAAYAATRAAYAAYATADVWDDFIATIEKCLEIKE